jgi:hypothetical protein
MAVLLKLFKKSNSYTKKIIEKYQSVINIECRLVMHSARNGTVSPCKMQSAEKVLQFNPLRFRGEAIVFSRW